MSSGSPCWATQPVKPSPKRAAQQLHVDLLVCADPALERDRDDLVGRLDEVDPGVVVVDDPARLLDDGPADLARRSLPGSSGRTPPGGPRAGRRAPRSARTARRWSRAIAAWVARVVMNATSPLVQARGSRVTADSAPITRSWWISGAIEVAGELGTRRRSARRRAAGRRGRPGRPGRARSAGPRRPSPRRAGRPAGCGQLVGQAGPGRDLEAVVAQDPDRGRRRRAGPASSRRRSSGTARRDRARRPGARRCRGRCRVVRRAPPRALRPTRGWAGEVPSAALVTVTSAARAPPACRDRIRQPADEGPGPRDRRSVAVRGARRHPAPGRGIETPRLGARARLDGCTANVPTEVPPTVLVTGRTIVPGCRSTLDPLTVRKRPDYTPAASRPRVATTVRSRIRGQHDPVDDGPSPIDGDISRHHPEPGPSRLLTADRDPPWVAPPAAGRPAREVATMLYLSQAIGRPVLDANGEPLGKVDDLIVAVGDRYPPVTGLVVVTDRRRIFLPWSQVARFDACGARLSGATIDITRFAQRPNEILLRTDLLDKQIVDIDGRKVVRVNDLRLDDVDGKLHLVAVDVGASGLLRRLGIEGAYRILARNLRLPTPGALHRLGGRRPGRDEHRLDPAARPARGPDRAPPGRPRDDHRPARAARPGRRPRRARRRGGRRRDRGDGARDPGRGARGSRARTRRRHPRGDVARRRGRPRRRPVGQHPRGAPRR